MGVHGAILTGARTKTMFPLGPLNRAWYGEALALREEGVTRQTVRIYAVNVANAAFSGRGLHRFGANTPIDRAITSPARRTLRVPGTEDVRFLRCLKRAPGIRIARHRKCAYVPVVARGREHRQTIDAGNERALVAIINWRANAGRRIAALNGGVVGEVCQAESGTSLAYVVRT